MIDIKYKDLSLFLLRVGMGGLFLWAGWDKLSLPFSAAGFLKTSFGPFAESFKSLAGNQTVDQLVAWGLTLGGLALITGIGTRLASAGLALLMVLIYLAHFPPVVPNHLIDNHVIFILVLGVIWTTKAGQVWGLGKWLKVPGLLR